MTTPGDRDRERTFRFYERAARDYDRWMDRFDPLLLGDGRATLCARAVGRTLEVAIGTGRNVALYPPEVQLTGIDLSPAMLEIARRATPGRPVDLRVGNAEALEFPDEAFDTVVFTLCLCTVPDPRKALAEARRVLRPDGRLLLLEHVRSPIRGVRWAQRIVDPLFRLASDHLLRDPLDHLASLGFVIEECRRYRAGIMEWVVARRP
jgi:ubiquinone/menaquinone biosynthesis C-methylase UbiE